MKTMMVIGMGRFGQHLVKHLVNLGNEVMAVDVNEDKLRSVANIATGVQIGDCTDEEVLRSLGVANYDVCFVCIGDSFQNSLEITNLLKELGAQRVVSRASRDIQAKFLLRNGADEVTYPERDLAERLASRYSKQNIFDCIEIAKDVSVFEIPTLPEWVGKSIRAVDFRAKYTVSILGVKHGDEVVPLPPADHVFTSDEHLIVVGRNRDVEKIVSR